MIAGNGPHLTAQSAINKQAPTWFQTSSLRMLEQKITLWFQPLKAWKVTDI